MINVFAYRAVTFYGGTFQILLLTLTSPCPGPTTPQRINPPVWAVPLSLAATYGIDSLSFPPLTEMFHFSGYRSTFPMYSGRSNAVLPDSWVFPFGNPRVKAYLPLTEAYRSLSRPSSPDDAKASSNSIE